MPDRKQAQAAPADGDTVIREAAAAAEKLGWVKTGSTIDTDGSVVVSFRPKAPEGTDARG